MALLFTEGFEQYTTMSDDAFLYEGYAANSVYWATKIRVGSIYNNSAVTSPARTSQTPSGRSFKPGTYNGQMLAVPAISEIYLGFAIYPTSSLQGDSFLNFCDPTTSTGSGHGDKGIGFRLNASNEFEIYNLSSSTLLATSQEIPLNVWTYVEIKYIFGATGSLEVRFDTSTVVNLASVDTRGGLTEINRIAFRTSGSAGAVHFDDIYLCDNSGSTNNTFLGPIKVYTLFPNGDASIQHSRSGGSDNYTNISEIPVDGETSYVYGGGGSTDTYHLTDLPAITPVSINGVMVRAVACKSNNMASNMQLTLDSGGNVDHSSPFALLANGFKTISHIWESAPGGGAWTKALIDALKAGFKSNS